MKSDLRTALAGLLLMMLPGFTYGFSALSQPLAASYNWTPLAIATIFGVNVFCNGVGAFVGGSIADRYGSRYLAMVGALFIGLGDLVCAYVMPAVGFPGFVAGFGLLTGLGNGLVSISAISAIMKSRDKGFGFGGSVAVFGYGLGSLVYGSIIHAAPIYMNVAHAASRVIKAASTASVSNVRLMPMPPERIADLSTIYAVSGVVTIVIGCLFAAALPARAQRKVEHRRPLGFAQTVWTTQAWLIWFCWLIVSIAGVSIFGQALPILSDITHRPTAELTSLLTFYALAACVGRICLGTIADLCGYRRTLGVAFGSLAAVLLILGNTQSASLSIPAFALAYLVFGGIAGLLMGWTAKSFGTERFGSNWGWINSAFGIAGLCGPSFVGVFHQITGSYEGALMPIGILVAGGLVLPFCLEENFEGAKSRLVTAEGT